MKSVSPVPRNRGVALITVMFIMMLLTTLVVYLVEDEYLAVRRVANQQDSEQGFQIAVYSEQWARKLLEADVRDNQTDHHGEAWESESPALPKAEAGVLQTGVDDLQGRFNLNNLSGGRDEVWYPAFQRLLTVLELDPGLADAVVDWVDADINVSGHSGAEDAEYLLKTPSYRAANRMMADVGELEWIHGMTREMIDVLRPHVTALPDTGVPVNINTASTELMRALTPEILDEGRATSLMEGRGEEGYADSDQFLARIELAGQAEDVEPLVAVRSEYFEVYSRVEFGRFATVLFSIINRPAETRQSIVIQRRRGVS